ncbi:hypothetical protein [Pseudobacteriovorax antillogorgiicola]|uniref:hypothetical protein n=1 Tax=Pseudobacteriovorax antillogorgiicola TaxID=1513793 RepID=UPI001048BAF8|nr:hypothetical protein [Pseudobacteriovorax antillogorgiicola]
MANEHSQEDFRNLVSALLQTVNEVERSKFLTKLFGELYPTDLHDSEVIDDIRDKVFSSRAKSVAECNKCGRIWIQLTAGGQDYASFAPDSGDECLGILKF